MDKPVLKWCDPGCRHASFPGKEHLDGACHTFIALYCDKYERLVQKSALCLDLAAGIEICRDGEDTGTADEK